MNRPKIPSEIETQLLTMSRRRCAICFGIQGDLSPKRGQIAHLDDNASNNDFDNLAFLCLDHHDEYDSSTSQSKGLQIREVKVYRKGLYEAVKQYLEPNAAPTEESEALVVGDDSASALFSQGELEFYLEQNEMYRLEGLRILSKVHEALERYNEQTGDRTADLQKLLSGRRINLRAAKEADHLGGSQMARFANELVESGAQLPLVTNRMVTSLVRASAVASDREDADRSTFYLKLGQLRALREMHEAIARSASTCREVTATYPRGSSVFNRGKRLAVAAIDENIVQLASCADAIRTAEADLEKVVALFPNEVQ